jgi:ParB-like chromosome segregation protein Spo0J
MPPDRMARHIELWPLDRLIPYARNARTHSDEQVAQVAASIREFGFNAPILVDSDAGIIAGHARLLAARRLQLAEVPVVVLNHLNENQKRAYILVDNRLAENAGWDDELLRLEVATLRDEQINLDLLGFEEEELTRLLADQEGVEGLTDEDAVPELPKIAVSRPGDLWILDRHRLLCGDATVQADVERLISGDAADLVFFDPPYGSVATALNGTAAWRVGFCDAAS